MLSSGAFSNLVDPPVIAGTGHRPEKIGGYEFEAPQRVWIRGQITDRLNCYRPQYCISGMALGFDQDLAMVCVEMRIPFIAAIPFEGQEYNWPSPSQAFYRELLSHAYCVYVVTPGGYSAHKMQRRNEWMVDNCDILIACWDGTRGGTYNCVEYAAHVKRRIDRISPRHFFRGMIP